MSASARSGDAGTAKEKQETCVARGGGWLAVGWEGVDVMWDRGVV